MIRIVILLVLVVGSIVALLFIRGDENDELRTGTTTDTTAEARSLPKIVMRRLSVQDYAARGSDPDYDPGLAQAMHALLLEGLVKLEQLPRIASGDKVPLDLLNQLPGNSRVSIEQIEAMAKEKELSEEATKTLSRDRQVSMEVLQALAAEGKVARRWITAFKALMDRPYVNISGVHVRPGVVQMRTEILEYERAGRLEPVGAIEVQDARGTLRVAYDAEQDRWKLPALFDLPVMNRRMRDVASWLDGLGDAEVRSTKKQFHAQVQLADEDSRRVRIFDRQGELLTDIVVGMAFRRDGEGPAEASTWVREVGRDEVFLTKGRLQPLVNSTLGVWTDTRLFPEIERAEMRTVPATAELLAVKYKDIQMGPPAASADRTYSGETLELVLSQSKVETDGDSSSGPEPERPDPLNLKGRKWTVQAPESAVETEIHTPLADQIVMQLLSASFTSVQGNDPDNQKYGFADPVADVSVTTKDGSWALVVGNPVQNDTPQSPNQVPERYAHVRGSPFVVSISEYTVRGFQRQPDALVNPAAKTPAGIPGGAPLKPPAPLILTPEEVEAERKRKAAEANKTEGGKEGGTEGGAPSTPGGTGG